MMSHHRDILMDYFFSLLPHELLVSRASSKIHSGFTSANDRQNASRGVIRTNENLTRHVGTDPSFIDRGIEVEDRPKYTV